MFLKVLKFSRYQKHVLIFGNICLKNLKLKNSVLNFFWEGGRGQLWRGEFPLESTYDNRDIFLFFKSYSFNWKRNYE